MLRTRALFARNDGASIDQFSLPGSDFITISGNAEDSLNISNYMFDLRAKYEYFVFCIIDLSSLTSGSSAGKCKSR